MEYERSINFEDTTTETRRRQAEVLSTTHPSFNFWLALHLSTEDPLEIPLLLDAYFDEEFGYIENFVGQVEFLVLKIIKHNIFSDCNDQKQAVVNWLRAKKKETNYQKSDKKISQKIEIGTLNIGTLQFNENENFNMENYFDLRSIQNNFNSTNIFYPDDQEEEKESDGKIIKTNQAGNFKIDESLEFNTNCLIPITLEYHKTLDYFLQLEKFIEDSEDSQLDIEYLVNSNFYFTKKVPVSPKKHLNISLQKQHLRYFYTNSTKTMTLIIMTLKLNIIVNFIGQFFLF